MAISKTQPMRSAEIDLIDTVNDNTTTIANLSDALTDEIASREGADTTLDGKIDTEIRQRANADTEIMNIIGTGFSSSNTISTNVGDIKDSIGSGFSSSNTIASNIGDIQDSIGSGFSSSNTIESNVQDLQGFDNRFRVGMTSSYTVAAGTSQAISVSFNTPYETTDEIIVLICPVGASEDFTDIGVKVFTANYQGFTGSIKNDNTVDSHTVAVGFVSVKVN